MQSDTRKKRAACDECSSRKLKCSGGGLCARCQRENLVCVYSVQKKMGRPSKRLRTADSGTHVSTESQREINGNRNHVTGTEYCPDERMSLDEPASVLERTLDSGISLTSSVQSAPLLDPQFLNAGFDYAAINEVQPVLNLTSEARGAAQCSCLANSYLALDSLQSDQDLAFPFALGPLRASQRTAREVLYCEHCRKSSSKAALNLMLLTTLLNAITLHYEKVLNAIDVETNRVQQTAQKKAFDLGDSTLNNFHLHTGTADCPGKFTVDLDPQEWQNLTKRVVKKEILGMAEEDITLEKILAELETRQIDWHKNPQCDGGILAAPNCPHAVKESDYHCIRMTKRIRDMVSRLPL